MKKSGLALLLTLAIAGLSRAADQQMTLPPGFVYEDLYRGNGMTAIDFDPTGAIFVCEKMGRVLLTKQPARIALDNAFKRAVLSTP